VRVARLQLPPFTSHSSPNLLAPRPAVLKLGSMIEPLPNPSASRGTRIGVAVFAILLTLFDHIHSYWLYLMRLNTERTLLPRELPVVEEPVTPPLARRVVIVFLEAGLPALEEAAAQGVRRPLAVEFPSFTYPAVISFNTGVPPLYSGLRVNHEEPSAGYRALPTLLEEARRAGIETRISSDTWPLFHDLLDPERRSPELKLEDLLARDPEIPALDWIYFRRIDQMGHRYGGRAAKYRQAAEAGDRVVARVLTAVDLSKDAVLIISDHGHLPRGGHGGGEPEIRRSLFIGLGAGIQRLGPLELRSMLDVPPTAAALLGLAPPPLGLGRPMIDLLAQPREAAARARAPAFAARIEVEVALSPDEVDRERALALLGALRRGDPAGIAPAERFLDDLAARREAAYEEARDGLSWRRLSLALPGILLLFLGGAALLGGAFRLRARDFAPALVYGAIFCGLYAGAGYGVSFSVPRGEVGFLGETLLFGAVGASVAFRLSRRRGFARLAEETAAMLLCFGPIYLLSIAYIGLDAAYLAAPLPSFLALFLATLGFYGHGPFGIYLLSRTLRPPLDTGDPPRPGG
jgi:hypothetical protein